MYAKWRNFLSRMLWFELLPMGIVRLFLGGLYRLNTGKKRRMMVWVAKMAVVCLPLMLFHCALLFGLGSFALYLNDLLGSSYQGFLVVSGGCLVLFLLLRLSNRIR